MSNHQNVISHKKYLTNLNKKPIKMIKIANICNLRDQNKKKEILGDQSVIWP